jgi:flagellar hook-associated protein 3 FlgL
VAKPSQDLASWTDGARARARAAMSDARGETIGKSIDRLAETDRALDGIGGVLSRASELATQFANGTYTDQERQNAALELTSLRDAAVAFANTKGPDGEYLLAGSASTATTPPFDATGAYSGDGARRTIEVGEGQRAISSVPGSVLTAANGQDVFGPLNALIAVLSANDQAGVRAQLDPLTASIAQVAGSRTEVGERMSAMISADDARQSFELELNKVHDRAVMADPVVAASELAQAQQAFESSRTVAQQIFAMFKGG